jgi:Hint domain
VGQWVWGVAQYYFEIYTFGSTLGVDNDAYGTGSDGFVVSGGANNAQNNAWGSMQNGGWSVGPSSGAEFYLTNSATKIGIWVSDDDAFLQDGAGDTGAAQVLVYPVTINGVTFPAGSRVELEYAVDTDAGGDGADYYIVRLGGNGLTEEQGDTGYNVGILETTSDSLQKMTVYHVDTSIDGPSLAYLSALCFVNGTGIATPAGPVSVEDLRPGDKVSTLDHGAQEVRWIGRRTVSLSDQLVNPDLCPIRFEAGAVGNDRPLLVSPQHRMLIRDWRAQLWYGEDEILVAAKALVNGETIRQVTMPQGFTYYHLLFDHHEILLADGAWSESFHPGVSAQVALSGDQHRELSTLFPDLARELESRVACYPVVRPAVARGIVAANRA